MTRRRLVVMGAVMCGLALATIPLRASDPIGVYCVVQKVVMAPDEQHPTTVQVWGACSMPTGGMSKDGTYTPGWYSTPRKGYLYYSVPKGKDDICLREWSDFKRVAGTGEVVGFGGRYMNLGRVRGVDETPKDPDLYPIHLGVTRINSTLQDPTFSYNDLITALKKAVGAR